MRILAIGDIHGRSLWKDIISEEKFDKVVFVGDYFDSFYIKDGNKQLDNFLDIVQYKKDNPETVRLLLGNHDFHYLPCTQDQYSGFQPVFKMVFGEVLQSAINDKLIKICWHKDKIMYSHAGLSRTWLEYIEVDPDKSLHGIQERVNDTLLVNPRKFEFCPGRRSDPYGDETTQGPTWIRTRALSTDMPPFKQVFGHTQRVSVGSGYSEDLVCIDCLEYRGYAIVEDGVVIPKRLKRFKGDPEAV